MSAFIVAPETIENILNGVEACGFQAKQVVINDYSYGVDGKYDAQKFGEEMADLNLRAVETRYNEKGSLATIKYKVKIPEKTKTVLMKALVSLQCLKYQCDEFDYEEPTQRTLDRLELYFLREIVKLESNYKKIVEKYWN